MRNDIPVVTDVRSESGARPPVYAAAIWGVVGIVVLLTNALWRLTPMAIEPIRDGLLTSWQIALYAGWVIWMGYAEAYKGFQKQFAPRVAARAMYLARNPRPLHVALAPLFCMGLFHATRKRLIVSWSLLTGIVILVIIVRQLEQPYRGIVDGGVVFGLAWGLAAVIWFFASALAGRPLPATPEVPHPDER